MWVEENATSNYALVAPTAAQARDVMVEGESGLNVFPPHHRPEYEPSKCKITFHSGATAHLYSADEPDRLRGVQQFVVLPQIFMQTGSLLLDRVAFYAEQESYGHTDNGHEVRDDPIKAALATLVHSHCRTFDSSHSGSGLYV